LELWGQAMAASRQAPKPLDPPPAEGVDR